MHAHRLVLAGDIFGVLAQILWGRGRGEGCSSNSECCAALRIACTGQV